MLATLFVALATVSAVGSGGDSLSSCPTLLDSLAAKTQANYAGFLLEVKAKRRAQYDSTLDALHGRARASSGDACYFSLAAYTEQFHDPHVFLFQSTYLDTAEIARRAAIPGFLKRAPLSEDSARRYFKSAAARLDPVEGIWRSGALRVAVVHSPGAAKWVFDVVVLESDTSTWRPGDVRAAFARQPDGSYQGVLWMPDLAQRFVSARIYKHALLRFDPGMWAKEFPVAPADSGLVSLEQPQFATLTWRRSTAVLSVPSNDPTYRETLFSIVAGHRAEILAAPRLIVDIRGNEGGSSWVTDTILPLLMSAAKRPASRPPDDPQMLSSADNMAYVRQRPENISNDSLSIVRFLQRLQANPGRLVPIEDAIDHARDSADFVASSRVPSPTAEPAGPRRVAILIDRGTVSAAEVFLRVARRSLRVTVYGENTAGALDYMSVSIVRIGDPAHRWALGYPIITARPDLPRNGMRGIGMAPDVRVDWSKVPDAIGWADSALSR